MKQLLLIISFIIVFSMSVFSQTIFRKVGYFAEIPTELLNYLDKMGVDSSLILNEYEGKYLNFIFNLNTQNFNLVGKKVVFLGSKMAFFKDERDWFYRGYENGVGYAELLINQWLSGVFALIRCTKSVLIAENKNKMNFPIYTV